MRGYGVLKSLPPCAGPYKTIRNVVQIFIKFLLVISTTLFYMV
jgi:hypothetical protein